MPSWDIRAETQSKSLSDSLMESLSELDLKSQTQSKSLSESLVESLSELDLVSQAKSSLGIYVWSDEPGLHIEEKQICTIFVRFRRKPNKSL